MQNKLLIVDDDKELVKMLKYYFELRGYLVYTAKDGKEALEKIAITPDLILLDINMPYISGIEVCKLIRNKVSCPILFLTAKVEEEDIVNALFGNCLDNKFLFNIQSSFNSSENPS